MKVRSLRDASPARRAALRELTREAVATNPLRAAQWRYRTIFQAMFDSVGEERYVAQQAFNHAVHDLMKASADEHVRKMGLVR